jgi:hypothetical protein
LAFRAAERFRCAAAMRGARRGVRCPWALRRTRPSFRSRAAP